MTCFAPRRLQGGEGEEEAYEAAFRAIGRFPEENANTLLRLFPTLADQPLSLPLIPPCAQPQSLLKGCWRQDLRPFNDSSQPVCSSTADGSVHAAFEELDEDGVATMGLADSTGGHTSILDTARAVLVDNFCVADDYTDAAASGYTLHAFLPQRSRPHAPAGRLCNGAEATSSPKPTASHPDDGDSCLGAAATEEVTASRTILPQQRGSDARRDLTPTTLPKHGVSADSVSTDAAAGVVSPDTQGHESINSPCPAAPSATLPPQKTRQQPADEIEDTADAVFGRCGQPGETKHFVAGSETASPCSQAGEQCDRVASASHRDAAQRQERANFSAAAPSPAGEHRRGAKGGCSRLEGEPLDHCQHPRHALRENGGVDFAYKLAVRDGAPVVEAIADADLVQPFVLDENFDYDNIKLTPRWC